MVRIKLLGIVPYVAYNLALPPSGRKLTGGIAVACMDVCICKPTKAFQPNTAPKNRPTLISMMSMGRFMSDYLWLTRLCRMNL